jgi:hypothetical protein
MLVRLMAYLCYPFLIYAVALTLQQGCSAFMICKDLNAAKTETYTHIKKKFWNKIKSPIDDLMQ